MPKQFNHAAFVGNLTADPEIKYLPSGAAVCEFSIANNDMRKGHGDQWVEVVTFIPCKAFGRTAEVMGEYLKKGSKLLVSGKLRLDQWEKDGRKHSKLYVLADEINMLDSRPQQGGGQQRARQPQGDEYAQDDPTPQANAGQQRQQPQRQQNLGGDDIPF